MADDDDIEKRISKGLEESITKAVIRKFYAIIALAVIGMGGGMGILGPSIIRDDPHTGAQALAQEKRIMERVKYDLNIQKKEILIHIKQLQVELLQLVALSESTKPPGLTRQRIKALEKSAEQTDPDYVQPGYEWK